jgi:hypothetical protein
MVTVAIFLAVILLAALCGYGLVMLLLPDEYRDEFGFLLMAPVGYCFYSWVAFNLSGTLQVPGRDTTILSLAVVAFLGLVSLLRRRPTAAMVRGLWPVLPLGLVAACVSLWPLFVVGAETFLGAVNPDYMATLVDIHYLETFPLRAQPLSKTMYPYSYVKNVMGGIGISARFASTYFAMMVRYVLGIPHRTALTICIGFFIFCLSPSVYFMARVAFGLRRRAALIAAALIVLLSPVTLSFVYFYVGQNSGMGVLPMVLTLAYVAVRRPGVRSVLLATLMVSGLYVMYTAMVPYALAPVGVVALYLLLTRRLPWRQALSVAGGFVGASVILNAGILSFLAISLKGWNRLISQTLQGQYFIDFLTEQFLPFYLGLVSYPMSASVYAPVLRDQGAIVVYAITLVVIITILAVVVRWARQEPDKASVVLAASAAIIYFIVWYTYTFRRPYGYALFKMCSWLQFMYVLPLAYALDQASGWGLSLRGLRRWAARAVWPICVFVVAAGVVSTTHLAILSLGHDTRRGMIVNLYDMSGNRDYLELAEQIGRRVAPQESVGLSFVDSIQNEWVSYYLRDLRTSLLSHYVIPADDENLPGLLSRWVTDYYGSGRLDYNYYFHGTTDAYYLTWSDRHLNRDIVERKLPPPIWQNGTFQLQRAADNPGFIYTGRGWYRLEFRNTWDWWWPDRFRWTAEGGEIYMLRGKAGQPYRLSFYGIVGHGLSSDHRTVELWMNTQKFDEVTITSAARVVSKPFYPTGDVDRFTLRIKERVRPLERSFRLWNRSLPGDYRRLNLLVAGVKVLPPGEPVPELASPTLSGEALFTDSYSFDGLQPNRWAGKSMSIALRRPAWARHLALTIFVPDVGDFKFPLTVRAAVDGPPVDFVVAGPGVFSTVLPLGPERADGLVELHTSTDQDFVPYNVDLEKYPFHYSFQLRELGLQP